MRRKDMYIKIKHIKQFFLIAACIFFASVNCLTYVNADDSRGINTSVCDKSTDSDCDGLTNSEEKLYATDANNSDSDGDGYSDGVEVKSGYDPLKPAPDDKLEASSNLATLNQENDEEKQLSSIFSQNLKNFLASKKDQKVTVDDIKSFADAEMAANMGEAITFDTLPDLDKSQIKILKQDYVDLSEEKRLKKEKEDASNYLNQMIYLFISNMPEKISSVSDLTSFWEDFSSRLKEYSLDGSNVAYFSDLGTRLESFSNQAVDVEVPETMVDLHIKFLRIVKGILTIRDLPFDSSDSMGKMIILSRTKSYTELFYDFLGDFQNYFSRFK